MMERNDTPPATKGSSENANEDAVVKARLIEKVHVLERHSDHLMGQLYHQVEVIRAQRDQVAHVEKQLKSIEETPKLLDEALKKIAQLKEDLAGRKEVELDLRRRIDDLEREEALKMRHIKRLEDYLHRLWYSPHRRFLRSIKNGFCRLIGRNPVPKELSDT